MTRMRTYKAVSHFPEDKGEEDQNKNVLEVL